MGDRGPSFDRGHPPSRARGHASNEEVAGWTSRRRPLRRPGGRDGGGRKVGLYVAKACAEAHGGGLEASRTGNRLVLHFELPIARSGQAHAVDSADFMDPEQAVRDPRRANATEASRVRRRQHPARAGSGRDRGPRAQGPVLRGAAQPGRPVRGGTARSAGAPTRCAPLLRSHRSASAGAESSREAALLVPTGSTSRCPGGVPARAHSTR